MANNYTVQITEASKELSHKQRVQLIDTTDCERLDALTKVEPVQIDVDFYAILAIHNEKSEDKDYMNYVVVDKDGTRYLTGSNSFWNTFINIYKEMKDESETWLLKVYRKPSKNRQGKDFITCSVI